MNHDQRIACLCTKSVDTLYALGAEEYIARPGWVSVPALKNKTVFEIKSADISSPGPSLIFDGLQQMSDLVARWHALEPQ